MKQEVEVLIEGLIAGLHGDNSLPGSFLCLLKPHFKGRMMVTAKFVLRPEGRVVNKSGLSQGSRLPMPLKWSSLVNEARGFPKDLDEFCANTAFEVCPGPFRTSLDPFCKK